MKIAFVGTTVEKTRNAFSQFIEENKDEVEDLFPESAQMKDGSIVKIVSLTSPIYNEFDRYEEIIWAEPGLDKHPEAFRIRRRLTDDIPEELRECTFN